MPQGRTPDTWYIFIADIMELCDVDEDEVIANSLNFDSKAERLFCNLRKDLRELVHARLRATSSQDTIPVEDIQRAIGWALDVMENDPVDMPQPITPGSNRKVMRIDEFRNELRGIAICDLILVAGDFSHTYSQ